MSQTLKPHTNISSLMDSYLEKNLKKEKEILDRIEDLKSKGLYTGAERKRLRALYDKMDGFSYLD